MDIALVALGLAVIIAVIAVFVVVLVRLIVTATQPVADAGHAFMRALQQGDWGAVHTLLHSQTAAETGQKALEAQFTAFQLENWSFSKRSQQFGGTGLLRGFSRVNGQRHRLEIRFKQSDGQWRVSRYHLPPAS